MMLIEVAKVGKYRSSAGRPVEITQRTITDLADSFERLGERNPVPLVIGHPKQNHPAYGWVESLQVAGRTLIAKVKDVQEDLKKAVKDGRYRKVSVSFHGDHSPANPNKGGPYLRHVGILGAATPAVPDLAPISLSDESEAVFLSDYIEHNPAKEIDNKIEEYIGQGKVHPREKEALMKVLCGEIDLADDCEEELTDVYRILDRLPETVVLRELSAHQEGRDGPKDLPPLPDGWVYGPKLED